MGIKKLLARLIIFIARYKVVTEPPTEKVSVLIAAPHTSNWDFFLMLAMAWHLGLDPRWLGKKEMFAAPIAPLFRKLGGTPVNRDNPAGLVEDLIKESKESGRITLVIPAEGTRTKKEYWKSGFYRIARGADIPLLPSWLDGPTRTGGIGEPIPLSGDVKADMDLIRAFYADKRGVKPENKTEPLLREEETGFGDK